MNQREAVLATLRREPVEFVPRSILFSTPQAQQVLAPIAEDIDDGDERQIALVKSTGSCFVSVSGHLRTHVVEKGENRRVVEYENGARRLIVSQPEWYYKTLSRPLDETEDLSALRLPDASKADRWTDAETSIRRFREAGYFIRGTIHGFYSGAWYYSRSIDRFLLDLAQGGDFIEGLLSMWGNFQLASAKALLERGVDGIYWCDDLGDNRGTLISPEMYRRYFFVWHRRAAELAHQYGAVALMHSHGNINKLMGHIVETGIDMLDPVGPSDGMDLRSLKERYGDRLSFMGGISRFIGEMSSEQLDKHVRQVYEAGCAGGGFIPSSEGGVPRNMTPESFERYLQLHRRFSEEYAASASEVHLQGSRGPRRARAI